MGNKGTNSLFVLGAEGACNVASELEVATDDESNPIARERRPPEGPDGMGNGHQAKECCKEYGSPQGGYIAEEFVLLEGLLISC